MRLPERIGTPPARAHEAELERVLGRMIDQVRATLPRLHTLGDVRAFGAALRRRWPQQRIRAIVTGIGGKAHAHAARPWGKVERERSGSLKDRADAKSPGEVLLEKWSRKAAALITSVRDEAVEGLRRDVVRAIVAGADPKTLADRWRRNGVPLKGGGTLEGCVRVIAQHQLTSLHAEVQRERAKAVGVTHFVWRTQGDAKVRDAHRALEGRTFAYDDPPSEGLPGQPVNCRCYAESVIPDELLGDFGVTGVIEG